MTITTDDGKRRSSKSRRASSGRAQLARKFSGIKILKGNYPTQALAISSAKEIAYVAIGDPSTGGRLRHKRFNKLKTKWAKAKFVVVTERNFSKEDPSRHERTRSDLTIKWVQVKKFGIRRAPRITNLVGLAHPPVKLPMTQTKSGLFIRAGTPAVADELSAMQEDALVLYSRGEIGATEAKSNLKCDFRGLLALMASRHLPLYHVSLEQAEAMADEALKAMKIPVVKTHIHAL